MAAGTIQVLFGSAKKPSKKGGNPSTKKPVMFGGDHMGAPGSQAMLPEEPSHEEKLHRAAADEHVNAARDFVAGRISSKQYGERKERAARFMRHTPKSK